MDGWNIPPLNSRIESFAVQARWNFRRSLLVAAGSLSLPSGTKLGYVILYVKDVLRSIAFYEEAFGLKRRFVHEAGLYVEMDTGGPTVSSSVGRFFSTHGLR